MFASIKARLFRAFGDWVIRRAMRTPYFHLFHDDGRPYMERYWLLRIGMPSDWHQLEARAAKLERYLSMPNVSDLARKRMQGELGEIRAQLYPLFGIRVHRIMSSDTPVFHDHPWDYRTLILRGGYVEVTPDWTQGLTPSHIVVSEDYDGHPPQPYGLPEYRTFGPGSLLRRKAGDWHYLLLPNDEEAWTLFMTGPKRQGWGFLVDGVVKVPWRVYLDRRRRRARAMRLAAGEYD